MARLRHRLGDVPGQRALTLNALGAADTAGFTLIGAPDVRAVPGVEAVQSGRAP